MKATVLKEIIHLFNRETLGKLLKTDGPLTPEAFPADKASITHPLEANEPTRCDCFCGKTSKGYKSAGDFVNNCLTLSGSNATIGSVAVGAVIDKQTEGKDDDLPVVLVVGANYGQGAGYLNSPVPIFDATGLHPKLAKVRQFLSDHTCKARNLDESFHLVAANFFPWITSQPWSSYRFNSIEESALIFCCGHADPCQYILELIGQVDPVAVVFHGANNAVPYFGTSVVQKGLVANSCPAFEVVFADNLAGGLQPEISNSIRLGCLDADRASIVVRDYDE